MTSLCIYLGEPDHTTSAKGAPLFVLHLLISKLAALSRAYTMVGFTEIHGYEGIKLKSSQRLLQGIKFHLASWIFCEQFAALTAVANTLEVKL